MKDFKKNREFLICVDSDGCAMDTMDIKHIHCFGPCMVEEWALQEWSGLILEKWNEINLYTMTRGINRFKGLAKMLREVDQKYILIPDIEILEDWAEMSSELSNEALRRSIAETDSCILQKALAWSEKVNRCIDNLPEEEKKPFEGVREALITAHRHADIAIVSSANVQAVIEEWKMYGLLEHVDIVLAQDTGSKAFCIQKLLEKGYERDKVVMIGDALGDYEAAKKNGVFYYPILVRREKESWREFQDSALDRLMDASYGGAYQRQKVKEFMENLKG